CSQGNVARGSGAEARRLHAVGGLPGRHATADVRVPRAQRDAVARSVREVRRSSAVSAHARVGRDRAATPRVDTAVAYDRARVTSLTPARTSRALAALVPLAFLGVFFVYPVAAIVARGLAPGDVVDLGPVRDTIADAALRHIAWFTVWQAAVSTVCT